MHFDMSSEVPTVTVQTFSSHYLKLSGELDTYALWYRRYEQPGYSDPQFLEADEFVLTLDDFRQRFGTPRGTQAAAKE